MRPVTNSLYIEICWRFSARPMIIANDYQSASDEG